MLATTMANVHAIVEFYCNLQLQRSLLHGVFCTSLS